MLPPSVYFLTMTIGNFPTVTINDSEVSEEKFANWQIFIKNLPIGKLLSVITNCKAQNI